MGGFQSRQPLGLPDGFRGRKSQNHHQEAIKEAFAHDARPETETFLSIIKLQMSKGKKITVS
jgi:hypothetical protein